MKLIDIVAKHDWTDIEPVFIKLYPDWENKDQGFFKALNCLQQLNPVDTDFVIVAEWVTESLDDEVEEYVNISGRCPTPTEDGITSYDLTWTPWEEWLGMEIDEQSVKDFSELEILCHCLWEMTFMGFDQETIKEEIAKITNR